MKQAKILVDLGGIKSDNNTCKSMYAISAI